MWWKLLHHGLQGALGLLYTYIHITPSGGHLPLPTFLALGISHQLFTCILGNGSNGSSVSNPSKPRFRAAGYNPRLATGISSEAVFWNWAFHLWDRALLHLSELSWTTESPPHTLNVNGSSDHHLVLHWGYRKNTVLVRVHRRSTNTPTEVRHSQKFLLSRKKKCWHSKLQWGKTNRKPKFWQMKNTKGQRKFNMPLLSVNLRLNIEIYDSILKNHQQ